MGNRGKVQAPNDDLSVKQICYEIAFNVLKCEFKLFATAIFSIASYAAQTLVKAKRKLFNLLKVRTQRGIATSSNSAV